MAVSVSSFGTTQLSELNAPPVPVIASFNVVTGDWKVVFDKDLVSGVQSSSGFSIIVNNVGRGIIGPIVVDGNMVSGESIEGGPVPLSDRIVYNSALGVLVGVNGQAVETFLIVPFVGVPIPESAVYSISEAEISILFSEPVFINTATLLDFDAVATPFSLIILGLSDGEANEVILSIAVDGPGDLPDRVEYSGKVDGIENAGGDDVPAFTIGLETIP